MSIIKLHERVGSRYDPMLMHVDDIRAVRSINGTFGRETVITKPDGHSVYVQETVEEIHTLIEKSVVPPAKEDKSLFGQIFGPSAY